MFLPISSHLTSTLSKQYAKHVIATQFSWRSNPNYKQSKSNQIPIYDFKSNHSWLKSNPESQPIAKKNPIANWFCSSLRGKTNHRWEEKGKAWM